MKKNLMFYLLAFSVPTNSMVLSERRTLLRSPTLLLSSKRLSQHVLTRFFNAIHQDNKDEIMSFIENYKNVNVDDEDGCSALALAIMQGHTEIVKILLEAGARPNRSSTRKWFPLAVAIKWNRRAVAKLLLSHNPYINKRNDLGETPLSIAVRYNRIELARLLIEHGANIFIPNKDAETPLEIAKKYNRHELIPFLDKDPYEASLREVIKDKIEDFLKA